MAEVMTVETIIEAEWLLQGFWTKLRFPFRTSKGAWSDVDVLAYHPESKHLVISESKALGGKKDVWAITEHTLAKHSDILKWDDGAYFGFLRHIKTICKNGVVFENFNAMVNKLTIQLVSNCYVSEDAEPTVLAAVETVFGRYLPASIDVGFQFDTAVDVICRVIKEENRNQQGRRYGHPIIDMARELNRYMHPDVHDAGKDSKKVREALRERLSSFFPS